MWNCMLALFFTLEQVTIMPLLNRRCRTASQWCISVFTISPVLTFQTRTVESLDPLIITLSSYCKHNTEPVCPMRTLVHCNVLLSQIFIVLSLRPDTIFWSSYCKQYTPLLFSDLQFIRWSICLPCLQLFSMLSISRIILGYKLL